MSSTSGASGRSVIQRLQDDPSGFELEQVYRIIRQLGRKGGHKPFVTTVVCPIPRYAHHHVLSIEALSKGWKVVCAAEALTGSRGVLPNYLRDAALATEVESGDSSMAAFLQIFESPWFERLARGGMKYDLCALTESERNPSIQELLLHLMPGGERLSQFDRDLFRFSGLLGRRVRTLEGLRTILSDYFDLRVVVRAASVKRHMIDPDALPVLGSKRKRGQLGRGMPLGLAGYLDSWRVDVLLMPRSQGKLRTVLESINLGAGVKKVTSLYLGDNTPSAVFVMARRKFLKAPQLSSRNPQCQLGQSVCLAPERYPEGVVRIRLRV